jgi:hypothetical protein
MTLRRALEGQRPPRGMTATITVQADDGNDADDDDGDTWLLLMNPHHALVNGEFGCTLRQQDDPPPRRRHQPPVREVPRGPLTHLAHRLLPAGHHSSAQTPHRRERQHRHHHHHHHH